MFVYSFRFFVLYLHIYQVDMNTILSILGILLAALAVLGLIGYYTDILKTFKRRP